MISGGRWSEFLSLAERVLLMGERLDVQKIQTWHWDRGFDGAVVGSNHPKAKKQGGWFTSVIDRGVEECYYVYSETNPRKHKQHVFIRGTRTNQEMYDDLLIAKDWDPELSCYVHHGFRIRAEETLDNLTPLLDKKAEISLCGHSLGGAVATIVGMKLEKRSFDVREVVTFGAPKVFASGSAKKLLSSPRIVRLNCLHDLIPFLPFGFRTLFTGPFSQCGEQLLLLPSSERFEGPYFCHLKHEWASLPWIASCVLQATIGTGLTEHSIESYVARLKRFAASPDIQQLPFSHRFMPMKQRYSATVGDDRAD